MLDSLPARMRMDARPFPARHMRRSGALRIGCKLLTRCASDQRQMLLLFRQEFADVAWLATSRMFKFIQPHGLGSAPQ